jgi:hypothetical protein
MRRACLDPPTSIASSFILTTKNEKINQFLVLLTFGVAALIAGCGGGGSGGGGTNSAGGGSTSNANGSAKIGGTVTGFGGDMGLLLNGTDPISPPQDGAFSFHTKLPAGATYNVTVPEFILGQSCTVTNGTGTVDQNADAVTNIAVTCGSAPTIPTTTFDNWGSYTVKVTVSGLNPGVSTSLFLDGMYPIPVKANGIYEFSVPGPKGGYQVTTSATNQLCILINDTDAFPAALTTSPTAYVPPIVNVYFVCQ